MSKRVTPSERLRDATSHDELLTRLHAAQTGFRDEGLSLDLPGLSDPDHIAALGPRLDSATLARLRRFACPTTAAALMLALATDANSHQLALTSAFWTCRAATFHRAPAHSCVPRCSPRTTPARCCDHHGRLMANLVRRGADRVALPEPLVERRSNDSDPLLPGRQARRPRLQQSHRPCYRI